MKTSDSEFFVSISGLAKQILSLTDMALPEYKNITDDIICGQIKEITEIEHTLDNMLTFCFDDRILLLYKKVLRHIYNDDPDTVHFYIEAYYNMYKEEKPKKQRKLPKKS